jgi:hypothetical protein
MLRSGSRRFLAAGLLTVAFAGCAGDSPQADGSAAPGGTAAFGSGSLIGADSLSNTTIGGPKATVLAFRFRAGWTGRVRAVRFHVIFNTDGRTGYSGGTHGVLRVALAPDAGDGRHAPARRTLGRVSMRPTPGDEWPLVRFARPVRVDAGRFYYVVFTNVDPDPRTNYTSVNSFVQHGQGEAAPRVPDGLGVLLSTSPDAGRTAAAWRSRAILRHDRYVPILEVLGSGPKQRLGAGYIEAWESAPRTIGGAAGVRQLFRTAARPAEVTGAWLRVQRLGQASAPLELSLETPSGSPLASSQAAAPGISNESLEWVHVRFARPARLQPGALVALRAAAPAPSAYTTFPVRKGADFGFDPQTFFDRGYAQFTDGAGWTGWEQWDVQDRHDGDLQFALDVR